MMTKIEVRKTNRTEWDLRLIRGRVRLPGFKFSSAKLAVKFVAASYPGAILRIVE